ncbi:hypothetical protein GALMADRAFT_162435 [Galerina marginata CBS 339.88]|uniref:Uncharacterized protein n=1 Tax=Galerina marginata (strain CBS 339.88) TaxID=685588 RepID=A0A067SFD0_GALM3|nr:hypothetical protein GALMADRAFT_162435 [Galerina marginata CBS 339.88]
MSPPFPWLITISWISLDPSSYSDELFFALRIFRPYNLKTAIASLSHGDRNRSTSLQWRDKAAGSSLGPTFLLCLGSAALPLQAGFSAPLRIFVISRMCSPSS